MALLPTFSTPKLPQWRGNTSSEDMNTDFKQILYDLNTIFSEASKLVVKLNDLESRIRHESDAISTRTYAVSGLITSYEEANPNYKMFYADFYVPENVIYPANVLDEDKCVVDTEFGVVTLPVNNSFSKVYTTNISDGTTIVAPDLLVEITPLDEAGSVKIEETSPNNTFDGQDSTVWERKVRFNRDSSKSSVRCLMNITLPSMSNPYVNNLFVKPYPEGMEDIQLVTYDTLISQDNVIPTFPVDGENNCKSLMYSFNNIQPTSIKVYFRQRTSKMEDDYKTFVYGAKEIGIEKVEYKTSGKIGFKFTLPSYEHGILSTITSLVTNPAYDDITYKVNLYTSEAEFNVDLPIWTSSNSPITVTNPLNISVYGTSSVWVMVELEQGINNTNTPLLNSVTLTYTTNI